MTITLQTWEIEDAIKEYLEKKYGIVVNEHKDFVEMAMRYEEVSADKRRKPIEKYVLIRETYTSIKDPTLEIHIEKYMEDDILYNPSK